MTPPAKTSGKGGAERRKSVRKSVLDTFHVFLVIPKRGVRKIYLKDISTGGVGFYAEDEDKFSDGEKLESHFYINPSLRLPLALKVAHTMTEGSGDDKKLKVGCEFTETSSQAYRAYVSFIDLLEQLAEFVD